MPERETTVIKLNDDKAWFKRFPGGLMFGALLTYLLIGAALLVLRNKEEWKEPVCDKLLSEVLERECKVTCVKNEEE